MDIQGDFAQVYAGVPVIVPYCNIAITQPTVKDICAFGEDDFFTGVQLFINMKNIVKPVRQGGNPRLEMLSDFQLLMVILDEDELTRKAILQFFELILPDYKITFEPGSICFRTLEENIIVGQLNPMNVENFCSVLKWIFLPSNKEGKVEEYNPANDLAAEIAAKLKRGDELRAQMQSKKDKFAGSLFASYVSILSIGMNIPINVLLDYTPFQLYDSFIRYNYKISYDLYQKIATTPLMDVSKMKEPKNWMDDIYNV